MVVPNKKICFLTALKAEATPLINQFKLIRDHKYNFPVFKNHNYSLIVIGVGYPKIKERFSGFFKNKSVFKFHKIINIGISGGNKKSVIIGEPYLIKEVLEGASKKSFTLFIKQKKISTLKSLTSVKKPIYANSQKYIDLVDMEAYKICEILEEYKIIDKLMIIKIVSDYMDEDIFKLAKEDINTLIKKNISFLIDSIS
tara:strand:- start:129 stop:725 length:597 start_codon:yes stop_codon:yes gene_type:complete